MIHIKNLTVKNFMSVGNATQAIDFDRNDLTLVLGENLDLGGDGFVRSQFAHHGPMHTNRDGLNVLGIETGC